MLEKVKQISYSPNSSKVNFDPPIQFMDGDHKVAVIQLRGELDDNIKAVLRVKPPQGELMEVEGKTVPYKSIAREFNVPTDSVGVFRCQIVMSYTYETNVSEVFQYEVKESLK